MVAYLCSISAGQQGATRGACLGVFALGCVGSQASWHGLCVYEPTCQFECTNLPDMRPAGLDT